MNTFQHVLGWLEPNGNFNAINSLAEFNNTLEAWARFYCYQVHHDRKPDPEGHLMKQGWQGIFITNKALLVTNKTNIRPNEAQINKLKEIMQNYKLPKLLWNHEELALPKPQGGGFLSRFKRG